MGPRRRTTSKSRLHFFPQPKLGVGREGGGGDGGLQGYKLITTLKEESPDFASSFHITFLVLVFFFMISFTKYIYTRPLRIAEDDARINTFL